MSDANTFMVKMQVKRASSTTCCTCKCLVDLNVQSMFESRQRFKSLSLEKQREWILHTFKSFTFIGERSFYLGTNKVCQTAWQFIYGISNRRFYSLQEDFIQNGRLDGQSARVGTKHESEKVARARTWFEKFIANCGDNAPDEDKVFLPSCYTKKDIFESYVADTETCGMKSDDQIVKKSCFGSIWDRYFKNVTIAPRNKFTKCGICTLIKELGKECKTQAVKDEVKMLKKSHNDLQRAERRVYYKHRDKARSRPEKYMSLIIDGMDQSKTNIPHYTTDAKGHKIHFYKTHVTGVYSHGQKMSYQYIDCQEWSHDSDLTSNLLLRSLVSLSMDGALPGVLYLQMDNCWRENKNMYVLGMCALLVQMKIVRKIRLSFLMVGHTHEDIDQLFSHIASKLNKNNAVTLTSLATLIQQAYSLPHNVEIINYVFAIKDWLGPHIAQIKQHSRPHAFKFELCENGNVGMRYRHWSSEGDWKGDETGKPFFILEGLPSSKPSLSRGMSLHQNSEDIIASGVRGCSQRFTLKEREWWEKFAEQETSKREMWENMSDEELKVAGSLSWYLDNLKQYQEPTVAEDSETQDVASKKRTVEQLQAKSNTFKQVTLKKRQRKK